MKLIKILLVLSLISPVLSYSENAKGSSQQAQPIGVAVGCGQYLEDPSYHNNSRALTCYNNLLQKDPKSIDALVGMGRSAARLGYFSKAVDYANKAIALDPKNKSKLIPRAYNTLGLAYRSTGGHSDIFEKRESLDQAAENFKMALTLDPTFQPAYFNLMDVTRGRVLSYGHYVPVDREQANKIGMEIVKEGKVYAKSIGTAQAYLALGSFYDWFGENPHAAEDAVAAYQEAIHLDPKSEGAYSGIVWAYYSSQNYKQALVAATTYVKVFPGADSYALLATVDRVMAQKNPQEADHYFDEAVKNLKKAIEIDPAISYVRNRRTLVELYIERKDYADALAVAMDALKTDPMSEETWILGSTYAESQEKTDADASPVQAQPKSPLTGEQQKIAAAQQLHNDGDSAAALVRYQAILKSNPSSPEALVGAARAAATIVRDSEKKDGAAQAINYATKAIELPVSKKWLPYAYNARGLMYALQGQSAKAVKDYEQAIAIDPLFGRAYTGLADIYQNESTPRTQENFKKIVALVMKNPSDARLWNLGRSYASSLEDASKNNNLPASVAGLQCPNVGGGADSGFDKNQLSKIVFHTNEEGSENFSDKKDVQYRFKWKATNFKNFENPRKEFGDSVSFVDPQMSYLEASQMIACQFDGGVQMILQDSQQLINKDPKIVNFSCPAMSVAKLPADQGKNFWELPTQLDGQEVNLVMRDQPLMCPMVPGVISIHSAVLACTYASSVSSCTAKLEAPLASTSYALVRDASGKIVPGKIAIIKVKS